MKIFEIDGIKMRVTNGGKLLWGCPKFKLFINLQEGEKIIN